MNPDSFSIFPSVCKIYEKVKLLFRPILATIIKIF